MSKTLRLNSEPPQNTPSPIPVRYGPPCSAHPAYWALLLLVMAVGGVSIFAWYCGDFSLENRAAGGEPKAQYLLGKKYFDCAISPLEYVRAARLIRRAAEQGYAEAQTGLGLLYEHGLGLPKSYAEAHKWLRRAADQGYPVAQNELGVLYAKGHGVARNLDQAANWCRLAAAQGSEIARRNLELAEVANYKMIPQLTTPAKKSYARVLLQKVEADGITVSFRPQAGGFGLAKLKLEILPSDLQHLCKCASKQGAAADSAYSQIGAVSSTL